MLLCVPSAHAHGDGAARGFRSTVRSVVPAAGLAVRVLEGDDRLQVTVPDGHLVEIQGYAGEPYLRISSDGVFRNDRSPATYLNMTRFAGVDLPAKADATAVPVWVRVAPGGVYDWHDHRIHWMSRDDPPIVVADPDRPHRVFTWTVPGTLDGKPLLVTGDLEYVPPPGRGFPRALLVPLVALALLAVAVPVVRRRIAGRAQGGQA